MTPQNLTVSQWCWLVTWMGDTESELDDLAVRLDITEAQARELLHQIRLEAGRK